MFGENRYGSRTPNPRELRVVYLVAQGLKNCEVAHEIGTTENVVKNYLRVIYDKLGFSNRVELALWHIAHQAENPERSDGTLNRNSTPPPVSSVLSPPQDRARATLPMQIRAIVKNGGSARTSL
jgi:DNA-binding CsgD family transcriptional regulator